MNKMTILPHHIRIKHILTINQAQNPKSLLETEFFLTLTLSWTTFLLFAFDLGS